MPRTSPCSIQIARGHSSARISCGSAASRHMPPASRARMRAAAAATAAGDRRARHACSSSASGSCASATATASAARLSGA